MRQVDIYLKGPEGWAGWRRLLVVRCNDTEVLLCNPATLRRLKMRRSDFEAARPKGIVKDFPALHQQIERATQYHRGPTNFIPGWRQLLDKHRRTFADYLHKNLHPGGRPKTANSWDQD